MHLLAPVAHSAPTDDIVPEAAEEPTSSRFVSAVTKEPFESTDRNADPENANSEVTDEMEDSADEEDASTSLAQLSAQEKTTAEKKATNKLRMGWLSLRRRTQMPPKGRGVS